MAKDAFLTEKKIIIIIKNLEGDVAKRGTFLTENIIEISFFFLIWIKQNIPLPALLSKTAKWF